MNSQAIFLYILKTMLVSGIFLGYYWLALRNKKLHSYNRFYLLLTLVLSVIIPLLNFKWMTVDKPVSFGTSEVLNYIINPGTASFNPGWNWMDWIFASYTLIAFALLLIVAVSINKLYRIKRNSVVTQMDDIDFIDTEEDNAPFSYFKNLFWKRSIALESEEGKKIFKHELVHIQQKHTLDRLFCQLYCSVIWINPFAWLIQKELLTIHEFIADEQAIEDSDTDSFARMLLQAHYGDHFFKHTQSFFYSLIKRRLTMLTTSKHTRYSYVRRLIALPLLTLTIGVLSLQVNAKTGDEVSPAFSSTLTKNQGKKPPVQVAPKFPGGETAWKDFLRKTCNLNTVAEQGGRPGKYAVQLSFIVDKEGNIKDVRALNDPGHGSKEDAIRVLKASPKWTPASRDGKTVVYRDEKTITYVVSK